MEMSLCRHSTARQTIIIAQTLCIAGDEARCYTVFQKTCHHVFDDKLNKNCPFTKIFGTLTSKTIGHRQVFLVSHHTYLMQLLYLGKLSRPKYHEFSLKVLILSMIQFTRKLTAKLSPYNFTYLLFNLRFIIEQ